MKKILLIVLALFIFPAIASSEDIEFTASANGFAVIEGTAIDYFITRGGSVAVCFDSDDWLTTVVTPRLTIVNKGIADVPMILAENTIETTNKPGCRLYQVPRGIRVKLDVEAYGGSEIRITVTK